jgi:F0F1-type ATP synthase membrane subunit c/vacuolar-type H+-ATPase subunit K
MANSEPDNTQSTTQRVRVMQIIVLALCSGCLIFAGVVCVMRADAWKESWPTFGENMLDYVALFLIPLQLVMSFVLPGMIQRGYLNKVATSQQQNETILNNQLIEGYQVRLIIGCALAEAAAFLALVLVMLGASPYFLGLAAVCVLSILIRFPTVSGVANSVREQLEQIQAERQLASGS